MGPWRSRGFWEGEEEKGEEEEAARPSLLATNQALPLLALTVTRSF